MNFSHFQGVHSQTRDTECCSKTCQKTEFSAALQVNCQADSIVAGSGSYSADILCPIFPSLLQIVVTNLI